MLLRADESLLIVIDLQVRLMPAIHDAAAMLDRVGRLLRAARLFAVPVLSTLHAPRKLGGLVPAVAACLPAGAASLTKSYFSLAAEPGALAQITGTTRRQLVLCGAEAHVCVLQSALGLKRAGFDIYVVADAVGTRQPHDRELALARLRGEGVRIVGSEMVLFEWLGHADSALLKPTLDLVR